MTDGVPAEVRRLIGEHIVSVEQLEILLLLRGHPDVDWSSRSVSEEIRTSERSAAARLRDLEDRGFASSRDGAGDQYRYQPADATLRRAVEMLADTYAERRYTVIEMIFAKPIDKLRVYADAFRFRKHESDG